MKHAPIRTGRSSSAALWAAVLIACVACAAGASDPLPPEADASGVLDAYIARPQPNYRWTHLETREMFGGVMLHRLELVSQTWMGIDWTHPLNILVPPAAAGQGDRARPGHAVIVITAGDEAIHAQVCAAVASRMGVPVAVLHQVPNQPLLRERFNNGRGLWEDALIAQTFVEFATSGDADWPLLLPMARSVVSAMDALGEYSESLLNEPDSAWAFGKLERFLTTGASKRGWTTWLSAVADTRVFAIAPMVYDNLNLRAQIPLHDRSWGGPSPSIRDYTERGLLEMLQQPRGAQVVQIVDPFSYLDRLRLPKLLLLGTNDPYWPLGSVLEYISSLPGETWCHYVPNAGHSLGSNMSVLLAIGGFFDAVTGRIGPLPRVELTIANGEAIVRVVSADVDLNAPLNAADDSNDAAPQPASFRQRNPVLHAAVAEEGIDFRRSRWQRIATTLLEPGVWRVELSEALRNANRSTAFVAEVALVDHEGGTFLIHTPVCICEIDAENE